jgi:hypothetical protein
MTARPSIVGRASDKSATVTVLARNLPQQDSMWEVFMRNKLWATAIAIGFAAAANAASPSMHIDGTVSEVNRVAKSFTTQSSSGTSTYRTTDHTIFRLGATPTNWDAMKAGTKVGITYHLDGRNPVADEVVIGG